MTLDQIDKRILSALQQNGRLQNNELAQQIGLSPSPCLRRVKILEDNGIIEKYTAIINTEKIGKNMLLFTRVWLTNQDIETVEKFTNMIQGLPQILECHLMVGDSDFLLKVLVSSLEEYRQLQIEYLTREYAVQNIKTEIPMQRIKYTSEVPL